ncbi:hypothetical protein BDW59DRAFT_169723 [Aspergillus cavernicola]|uniref:AB hydrolase-1 domain-containing protein n=1 Tax=Aspergillus cavernicola TaxID=176166 RepID=A0ABR4IUW6_9EURO
MLFLLNQFKIPQPVIGVGHSMGGIQLVHLSLMHPSLFEALQAWDPRVLQKWVDFGLRDLPTKLYPTPSNATPPAVTLITTKAQELFNFLRPSYIDKRTGLPYIDDFPFYRPEPPQIFRCLPELKPTSGGASRGRVQEIVLPCGHLVSMGLVCGGAGAGADFIGSATSCWKRNSKFQKAWEQVSHDERVTIDKQWESHISGLPKRSRL